MPSEELVYRIGARRGSGVRPLPPLVNTQRLATETPEPNAFSPEALSKMV
jgi:hypothetical protein